MGYVDAEPWAIERTKPQKARSHRSSHVAFGGRVLPRWAGAAPAGRPGEREPLSASRAPQQLTQGVNPPTRHRLLQHGHDPGEHDGPVSSQQYV